MIIVSACFLATGDRNLNLELKDGQHHTEFVFRSQPDNSLLSFPFFNNLLESIRIV